MTFVSVYFASGGKRCAGHGRPQERGKNGHLPPPWKLGLRTKIF